jgi:predicted membrane chloride channel (bestrophin family)
VSDQKIRKWLEYFMYAGFGLFFIVISIIFFVAIANKAMAKQWDALSFIGSIVGGAMTLLAVIITIKRTEKNDKAKEKRDFMKVLPAKIRIVDHITNLYHEVWENVTEKFRNERYDILNEIQDVVSNGVELKQMASEVDITLFSNVWSINELLKGWNDLLLGHKRNDLSYEQRLELIKRDKQQFTKLISELNLYSTDYYERIDD